MSAASSSVLPKRGPRGFAGCWGGHPSERKSQGDERRKEQEGKGGKKERENQPGAVQGDGSARAGLAEEGGLAKPPLICP